MTEINLCNEVLENAIGVYKTTIDVCKNVDDEDYNTILDKVTVAFLEELQQYRAIGTVEELKTLKEKAEPKKIVYVANKGVKTPRCPNCNMELTMHMYKAKFCNCGQKLDWK